MLTLTGQCYEKVRARTCSQWETRFTGQTSKVHLFLCGGPESTARKASPEAETLSLSRSRFPVREWQVRRAPLRRDSRATTV